MRRLLTRALIGALCLVLSALPALADGVTFHITADIDPVQWPEAVQPLMEGLAALCDVAALDGTFEADAGRFALNATLSLPHRDEVHQTALRVWGIPSHWCVETPLLGDTPLMLNNLALAEFGVKAWNHLEVPLQYAMLAVPYTHISAFAVLRPEVAALFPEVEGTTTLTLDELQPLTARIAELAEGDRTLRYWIEAVGIATGADQLIYEALYALPDALIELCPDGLIIIKDEGGLYWLPNSTLEAADAPAPLLKLTHDGPTTNLTATLPGLGTLVLSLRDDVTILTGTLHMESPLLTGEVAFSLPTALPVTLPFFLTVDAEGMLLGDESLHLVFEGEAHGNTLTIRQLLPDHSRTMLTLTAVLSPMETGPLPNWTAADIPGVNILSVTAQTLTELLTQVRGTLLPGLFDLVAALPARTCQALMDLLEDSGILGLLTDAMMNGTAAY